MLTDHGHAAHESACLPHSCVEALIPAGLPTCLNLPAEDH